MIPCYPDFVSIDLDIKDELHGKLSTALDGVSEFTFAGLYLFRGHISTGSPGRPMVTPLSPAYSPITDPFS
ncbi:hypothetical protein FACS189485_21710 [Spirochaetia bacterium]|nr:hypothetical protein FACS189485_21710 [Spirochaetia bacterium]